MSLPPRPSAPTRLAGGLALAALGGGMLIAFLSLPVFAIGYWDKAEPLVIGLHAFAGLGALGLALRWWRDPAGTAALLSPPPILACLLLAAWSLVTAPIHDMPLLTIFGTVQSGLGALWYLDLAILAACAGLATGAGGQRPFLLLCGVGSAVALGLAGLKFIDRWTLSTGSLDLLLLFVPAYYGWIGLALPVLAAALPPMRGRAVAVAAMLLAAALVLVASGNKTAMALTALGAVFVAVAHLGRTSAAIRALTTGRKAAVAIMLVAAIVPFAVLQSVPALQQVESLRDRVLVRKMVLTAMQEDSPQVWLTGQGWGRTQDAFHAHLNVTSERLWDPTWIFLHSDYFHSHTWVLETLYAAGLPGLLLHFAIFLAIPLSAAPERRPLATAFAAAWIVLQGVWFDLALSLPFLALAIATLSPPRPLARPLPRGGALGVAAAGAGLLSVAGLLLAFGLGLSAFRADPAGADGLPADPRGSDLAAAELIRDDFAAWGKTGPTAGAPEKAAVMFDYLARRIPETRTVMLLSSGLNALAQVHFTGELPWLAPHLPASATLWRPWLDRLLTLAPGRTDLAIPYLTRVAVAGNLDEVAEITTRIRQRDPNDAVGLYFAGLVAVMQPDPAAKQRGIGMLRQSAEAGIERFMPLDASIRALVGRP